MARRFDHFTFVAHNLKAGGKWKATLADQEYESWPAILDAVSDRGWEVVAVVPASTKPASGGQFTAMYHVFLKRPIEARPADTKADWVE